MSFLYKLCNALKRIRVDRRESAVGNYFWIIVGGGVGAAARYWVSGVVSRWTGAMFPWGTFVVNVLGCFAIGVLMASLRERFLETPQLRLFLTIGVMGGFTTFSTFSYETIMLVQSREVYYAALNAGGSLAACLMGAWLGVVAGSIL